jgi:type IV pilus assembly protein PilW
MVELLVAVAINMVVVVAAAYLYLGTRESQRVGTEKAGLYETGKFTLDLIGRDLENAGYYPAARAESAFLSNVPGGYINPVSGAPTAFNAGIFGCDSTGDGNVGKFQPTTSTCVSASLPTGSSSDTLVVNYFTTDAFGLDVGYRGDCQRQNVDKDAANSLPADATLNRRGSTTSSTSSFPRLPLFVSNRYTLTTASLNIEGNAIATTGLACNGNGVTTKSNTYQPLVAGIEQMRFRYGVFSTQGTQQPDQFLTAANVTADGTKTIGDKSLSGWQRVSSVRVCLLIRSIETAPRVGTSSYDIIDCDGDKKTYADGVERRVVSRIFGIKNKLTTVFPITPP